MGKYFGKQPRYSKQEAEAQAKQAIEAAVSRGRPPEDDWKPLAGRMAEVNQELAMRPRPDVDFGPPPSRPAARRPANQILRPRPAPVEEHEEAPAPAPADKKRAPRAAPAAAPKRSTPGTAAKRPATPAPAKRSATPAPAKRPVAKKKRPE